MEEQETQTPAPEPETFERSLNIKPHGSGCMALQCWEQFAWRQMVSPSVHAAEADVQRVYAGFSEILYRILMKEEDWYVPHRLFCFSVGRKDGDESADGKRFRIRDFTIEMRFLMEGEEMPAEPVQVPIRRIKFVVGPYDA